MFSGSIVALVTPFKDGAVDLDLVGELVEFQLRHGTRGIVPCGTTGEAATLDCDEREAVLRQVLQQAKGRKSAAGGTKRRRAISQFLVRRDGGPLRVIAGTGTNSTKTTIELTQAAKKLGADGALVVCPYYNKPTQEGLYRHFRAVAEAVDLPLMLYNVPGRTAVSLTADTVARLAQLRNVVAIKEASGNLDLVSEIRSKCPGLAILSGDDSLTLPILSLGGTGVVSVVANVVPADVAALVAAFEAGDLAKAREHHYKLFALARAMFVESNPVPVKAALRLLGRSTDEVRLPLAPISPEGAAKVRAALEAFGLTWSEQPAPAKHAEPRLSPRTSRAGSSAAPRRATSAT